ncbi:MAG: hypothetical protein FJ147_11560 [Deltaproteobacteria bacterium]|nr:hypothetical protein [Deltaproteobacteria bacterium]
MTQTLLPSQFSDLEPLAEKWAFATQNQREACRRARTPGEIRELYDVLLTRMDAILDYLNQFTLENMPPEAQRLMYLTFALAEVAPYVECYNSNPWVPDSFEDIRMVAVHGERVG